MFKNVASQSIALFAFDTTTGAPKTGDAANITAYVSKDYGSVTVLGDTSAAEMDSTNAKGWYLFGLTQSETNADALLFTAKSSTANISVVGQLIYTLPASFTSFETPDNSSITAIKAKTDNLPSDPADASVIAGRFDTLDTSVADLPTNAELATALTDLEVNVTKVAGTAVTGSGTEAEPWGP